MQFRGNLERWLNNIWYGSSTAGLWLTPLSWLYGGVIRVRNFLYAVGILRRYSSTVPVVVIGNISAGGAGKTPLVMHLAGLLMERGIRPGIITRGYRRKNNQLESMLVTPDSEPDDVGDEALMIYHRLGIPVAVGPRRVQSAALLEKEKVSIILSDDGLQHYALERDMEIAVVDGTRMFGNNRLLPAGPLREPVSRLKQTDMVIENHNTCENRQNCMSYRPVTLCSLDGKRQVGLSGFSGTLVHAIAGIGNPDRFFEVLEQAGIRPEKHRFSDHHDFKESELEFDSDAPLVMTEKDAVKCRQFELQNAWYLSMDVSLSDDVQERFFESVNAMVTK